MPRTVRSASLPTGARRCLLPVLFGTLLSSACATRGPSAPPVESVPAAPPAAKAAESLLHPAVSLPPAAVTEADAGEAVPGSAPEVPGPPTRSILCARHDAPDDTTMVDDMQVVMSQTTCSAALWLDGLFGDAYNVGSARRTSGYAETSARYSEFEGHEERVRFRVRFRLPNLKDRVSAVFGRDNENNVVRDRTEAFAVRSELPRLDDGDSWLTGLGYSFPGTDRFKADSRIGVSSLSRPRLYVQQRANYIVHSDDQNLVYTRGTAFWTNREGFGTTVGFDYTRTLTPTLLLRLAEVGTVSQNTEGLDWFSGVILYQNLHDEHAMAYELLIRGQTDEPEPLYEYGGRVVYRHPFIAKRLYGEFLVGYSWPRTDPAERREGSAQVGFSLEIPFGQKED